MKTITLKIVVPNESKDLKGLEKEIEMAPYGSKSNVVLAPTVAEATPEEVKQYRQIYPK